MTTEHAPEQRSAYDAFYKDWRGYTPANAVALAIEDHNAYAGHGAYGEFLHQLRVAEQRLRAYDELVAALERCIDSQECNGYIGVETMREARAALAKARTQY